MDARSAGREAGRTWRSMRIRLTVLAGALALLALAGVPGWRTERGEVYIRLGDPDNVVDTNGLTNERVIRWTYNSLRIVLYFRDDSGFNRYRLTPESRSEFERVASRLGR